jgi:hypothetical protein
MVTRDQADGVLPGKRATAGSERAEAESTPPECEIKLDAIAAGNNDPLRFRQMREIDHGLDNFVSRREARLSQYRRLS